MGQVFELPSAAVAREVREDFVARGFSTAVISGLSVSATQWRSVARMVARELGRPVQTLIVGGVEVTAWLRDWPANDEERAVHAKAMRAAINRIGV